MSRLSYASERPYLTQYKVKNYFNKPAPLTPPPVPATSQSSDTLGAVPKVAQTHAGPLWTPGTNLTLHFLLSPSPTELKTEGLPGFTWEGIEYGKWDESREWDGLVNVPEVGFLPLSIHVTLINVVNHSFSLL